MASKYDSIWQKLKATKECTIAAHRVLQPRIIKAVIKCKDRDVAFKLTNLNNRRRAKLFYSVDSGKVCFILTYYLILDGITVVDLM